MASEVKVDTISEYTSANGVAIDSVTIKDGVIEATGDTAAGDNAAMGYTSAEGLILTGQGSTNDVTIKNDADADVIEIPTGTVNVTMAGTLGVTGVVSGAGFTAGSAVLTEAELELLDGLTAGTAIASKVVTTDANIDSTGMRNLTISGELDAATLDISGAVDIAGALVNHGDVTLTGASTNAVWDASNNSLDFADSTQLRFGAGADLKMYHDASNSYIVDSGTGALKILGSTVQIMNAAGDENILLGTADGAVTIYNNNVALYNTSATENVFNEASNDIDFRVESNGNANAIFVNGGTDSVTIGAQGTVQTLAGIPFFYGDTGSIYTHDVSGTDDTAQYNTAYGLIAMDAITTGDNNVAVGYSAGSALTTGHRNVFLGQGAGTAITTGTHTIAIGNSAASGYDTETNNLAIGHVALGGSVAGGEYNVAIGNFSLDALTSGDFNTAVGYNAGTALTTGVKGTIVGYGAGAAVVSAQNVTLMGYNAGTANTAHELTAFGSEAALGNTSGGGITAIGREAYKVADTETHNMAIGLASMIGPVAGGEYNVAVGNYTLDALTSGDYNVALGYEAGTGLTTGTENTFLGNGAAYSITTGSYNTIVGSRAGNGYDAESHNLAMGYDALGGAVAGGEYNVAVGNYSLDAVTSADRNTAVGYGTGSTFTLGGENTAVGYNALTLSTGVQNVAIGAESLDASGSGSQNVGVGAGSLTALTDGNDNTGVGPSAGMSITTGDNNLMLGHDAGRTGSPGGSITTADNIIVLGDENISAANIQVDWTVASDKRDKTDVSSIDMGLDFINKLEPVTYRWDKRSNYDDQNPTGEHKEDNLDIGFLAQDVEVVENEYGYKKEDKTNLTTSLSEDGKQYGIQYSKFVPILVKAVQELSAEVKALKQKIGE